MPNSFKFNSSTTESLSLRKGNIYIGVGDVGKGPTSLTGFKASPSFGTASTLIGLHRGDGVFSWYRNFSDSELISRTNRIDTSQARTTKEQCFSYFAGQSDKILLNREYESIVTDGLVLNLDAGFLPSYPETGTTWNDLSGNENHVTLYNTPVYFDGTLSGDGTNSYGRTTNTLNLSGLSSITVISIWKQTTSTTGGMVYEHTANWNGNNNYSGVSYGGFGLFSNSNGTVTSENLNHHQLRGNVGFGGRNVMSPDTSNFQQYTTIHDFTGGINLETKVYINGNFVSGSSAGGNNNTSTFGDDYLYLWSRGGVSFSPNSLSLIMIYNRILTDSEILQNYNATKDRYTTTTSTTTLGGAGQGPGE